MKRSYKNARIVLLLSSMFVGVSLLSGCSYTDSLTHGSYADSVRWYRYGCHFPGDRTCPGNRPPVVRSDSLGDGGFVIIK